MQFKFGKIWLNGFNLRIVLKSINSLVASGKPSVVSVMNLRTIGISIKNKQYANLINDTALRITDGMPLVWVGKFLGIQNIERITGPDLFIELLESKYNYKHYFLGDTAQTINKMIMEIGRKKSGTKIVGYFSPPFRNLSESEILEISDRINQTEPDIIWVALGSPKQDYLSYQLRSFINHGILINVGAAFRFYIGEYKHPNPIFQSLGLEGIFWRFKVNPLKETVWYVKHVCLFLYLIITLVFTYKKNVKTESSSS